MEVGVTSPIGGRGKCCAGGAEHESRGGPRSGAQMADLSDLTVLAAGLIGYGRGRTLVTLIIRAQDFIAHQRKCIHFTSCEGSEAGRKTDASILARIPSEIRSE